MSLWTFKSEYLRIYKPLSVCFFGKFQRALISRNLHPGPALLYLLSNTKDAPRLSSVKTGGRQKESSRRRTTHFLRVQLLCTPHTSRCLQVPTHDRCSKATLLRWQQPCLCLIWEKKKIHQKHHHRLLFPHLHTKWRQWQWTHFSFWQFSPSLEKQLKDLGGLLGAQLAGNQLAD